MPTLVQLKSGTVLHLEDKEFATGGEGDLYKILDPVEYRNQVVKIYRKDKRTIERERKIDYLVRNAPSIRNNNGHHSVVWVSQTVYQNGSFCGFTMPLVSGIKLELLCYPGLSTKLGNEWRKFGFGSSEAVKLRTKLCFNIAVALYHIHTENKYILVDMKPENIMVQSNGLISIIDIDSVAVIERDVVIHTAPVSTPEFTPPEYYRSAPSSDHHMKVSWDRFSMAVIFYRLLCGIHPFAGTCQSPFQHCNTLSDMVKEGLFPNGPKRKYFKVIPHLHNNFNSLDAGIQELFRRCFDDGHKDPNSRPSPDDWCRVLAPEQGIQVSRKKPSSYFERPSYNFSKGYVFTPKADFLPPRAPYLNLKANTGIKLVLSNLFGQSERQKVIQRITQFENELKIKETKFLNLVSQLQNMVFEFRSKQDNIILRERQQVGSLEIESNYTLANFDRISKDLENQEIKEIREAYNLHKASCDAINKKVKETYQNLVGKKQEDHDSEIINLKSRLKATLEQEQTEINNGTNSPDKLDKYLISSADIKNFAGNSISALAIAGFTKFSDFTDIDAYGRIKNRMGKWIKVNTIGYQRAHELRMWQKFLEKREDQNIIDNVKRKYLKEVELIRSEIISKEADFQKAIAPFKSVFRREKVDFDAGIKDLHDLLKFKVDKIRERYDIKQADLVAEVKVYMMELSRKLKECLKEISWSLKENYSTYQVVVANLTEEISKFSTALEQEVRKLKSLHALFEKTR